MLYNMCYITFPEVGPELLYNTQVWLYNIQDGYITHPTLPDAAAAAAHRHCHGHVDSVTQAPSLWQKGFKLGQTLTVHDEYWTMLAVTVKLYSSLRKIAGGNRLKFLLVIQV